MLQMLSSLTGFDYLVLFVLLGCIWLGFRVGIVILFFFLMSFAGGGWIADRYAAQWGMNHEVLFYVSFAALLITGYVINRFLEASLGIFNSIMGAFAGVLAGLFFVSLALLPISKYVKGEHIKSVNTSLTMQYLAPELERRLPSTLDPARIEERLRLPLSVGGVEGVIPDIDNIAEVEAAMERKAAQAAGTSQK